MGAATPLVPILGAIIYQQQDTGIRNRIDQYVEQGLGFVVDPMQVLEDGISG